MERSYWLGQTSGSSTMARLSIHFRAFKISGRVYFVTVHKNLDVLGISARSALHKSDSLLQGCQ